MLIPFSRPLPSAATACLTVRTPSTQFSPPTLPSGKFRTIWTASDAGYVDQRRLAAVYGNTTAQLIMWQ